MVNKKYNSGIYKIKNIINDDCYIGQSINLVSRKYNHFWSLKSNKSRHPILQNAFNKYGKDNFIFEVILICDQRNLTYYEQICVDNLNSKYNAITECVNSPIGVKRTESFSKKMSLMQRERHFKLKYRFLIMLGLDEMILLDVYKRYNFKNLNSIERHNILINIFTKNNNCGECIVKIEKMRNIYYEYEQIKVGDYKNINVYDNNYLKECHNKIGTNIDENIFLALEAMKNPPKIQNISWDRRDEKELEEMNFYYGIK